MLMRGDINRLITDNIQPVIDHLAGRIEELEKELKAMKAEKDAQEPAEPKKRGPGRPKKAA